eukprot:TRINITY_DN3729_c0_g1_i7.p1 TRINITY_DN3729_c0_g1~~TRINITY_DN3729_c0_g1_i7.p1  ORF type:complete len:729 (+),score=224.70 TRINITY_DN3729_c0_g1_i7:140-2326(+)
MVFVAFFFGVLSTVVGAYIFLWLALLHVEKSSEERWERTKMENEEIKQELIQGYANPVISERKGRLRIEPVFNLGDVTESPRLFTAAVLKSNMLIVFRRDNEAAAAGVICLDNTAVGIHRFKTTTNSPFNKANAITLQHPDRDLLPGLRNLHIFTETGFELERWYSALEEASLLHAKRTAKEEERSRRAARYFSHVSMHLRRSYSTSHIPPMTTATTIGSAPPVPVRPHSNSLSRSASNSSLGFAPLTTSASYSGAPVPTIVLPATPPHSAPASPSHSPQESPRSLTSSGMDSGLSPSTSFSSDLCDVGSAASSPVPPPAHATTPTKDREQAEVENAARDHLANTGNPDWPNTSSYAPDWLNAILGRVFFSYHENPAFHDMIVQLFEKKISKIKKPAPLQELRIKRVSSGQSLPLVHAAQLIKFTPSGELMMDVDFTYPGGFTLDLEVHICFKIASKTVNVMADISVTVKAFSGKALVHVLPPPSSRLWLGFYTEPHIELHIDTSLGHNKRFKNLPKIASIFIHRIKSELIETFVLPNMDDFPLPELATPATPAMTSAPMSLSASASFNGAVVTHNETTTTTSSLSSSTSSTTTTTSVIPISLTSSTPPTTPSSQHTPTVPDYVITTTTAPGHVTSAPTLTHHARTSSGGNTSLVLAGTPERPMLPPPHFEPEHDLMLEKEMGKIVEEHSLLQGIANKKKKLKNLINNFKHAHETSRAASQLSGSPPK